MFSLVIKLAFKIRIALNTSLWSVYDNTTNGLTVNMNIIDSPTQNNNYYAIRIVSNPSLTLYYGNIKFNAVIINS